jgi:hypothetical protein
VAVTIRCTQKLLEMMRVSPRQLADAPADDDDWYANLLWFDRRKCLLLTHASTLFPVFIADVRAADLRAIGAVLERNAQSALYDEGLPADALGDVDGSALRIARTASRRILGVMTEDAYMCESAIDMSGGIAHLDTLDLNRSLRRTLHSLPTGGYTTALDTVRARVRG